MKKKIEMGNMAGHHFWGEGDLQVSNHCTCGDKKGYFHTRKKLIDRKAFSYCPTLGWSTDKWFEWIEE